MKTIEDEVYDRHLEITLEEVLRGSAGMQPGETRRSDTMRSAQTRSPRLFAAISMLLAIAAVYGVAVSTDRRTAQPVTRPSWQSTQGPPATPGASVVHSAAEIRELPRDATNVECRRLRRDDYALLRELPRIETLTISGVMDDGGMWFRPYPMPSAVTEVFEHLPRLRAVHFVALDEFAVEVIEALRQLPNLGELSVRRVDVLSRDHIDAIAQLGGVRRLCLEARGDVDDRALASLLDRMRLDELRLRGTYRLTEAGYLALAQHATLQVLDLSAPWYLAGERRGTVEGAWPNASTDAVTDAVLEVIARLPLLRELSVGSRRAISDRGLRHLARAEQLEELNVPRCHQVTAAGLDALPASLQRLTLTECPEVDRIPAHLTQLQRLDLRYCWRIDDNDVRELGERPTLEQLDLSDCPALTPACVASIARHEGLTVLRLRGQSWIDDDALGEFANLKQLEELDVGSYPDRDPVPIGDGETGGPIAVTSAGVRHLQTLPRLRHLVLNTAEPIDVAALRALAEQPLDVLQLAWVDVRYDDETKDLDALQRLWPGVELMWYPSLR